MPSGYESSLAKVSNQSVTELTAKHEARESGLKISREVIRLSANAIRAVHRREFEGAKQLVGEADLRLKEAGPILEHWPEIYHSGFLADARKEFTEANITLAIISGDDIPQPDDIGVDMAPYLNGMAEVIGELRRFILDSLRRNDTERCEDLLQIMDEIYSVLVTVDFPEGVTGGLRRTTDAMRGVLERTRGDLTITMRQQGLEHKLAAWEHNLSTGRGS